MDQVLEFFKGFNLQMIISIFFMLWYFASHIENKIEKQAARTDRLYEMFIDIRKEGEQFRKDVDQKFYDILKETKTSK